LMNRIEELEAFIDELQHAGPDGANPRARRLQMGRMLTTRTNHTCVSSFHGMVAKMQSDSTSRTVRSILDDSDGEGLGDAEFSLEFLRQERWRLLWRMAGRAVVAKSCQTKLVRLRSLQEKATEKMRAQLEALANSNAQLRKECAREAKVRSELVEEYRGERGRLHARLELLENQSDRELSAMFVPTDERPFSDEVGASLMETAWRGDALPCEPDLAGQEWRAREQEVQELRHALTESAGRHEDERRHLEKVKANADMELHALRETVAELKIKHMQLALELTAKCEAERDVVREKLRVARERDLYKKELEAQKQSWCARFFGGDGLWCCAKGKRDPPTLAAPVPTARASDACPSSSGERTEAPAAAEAAESAESAEMAEMAERAGVAERAERAEPASAEPADLAGPFNRSPSEVQRERDLVARGLEARTDGIC